MRDKMRKYNVPILTNKKYRTDSVFVPKSLLREARRQKNIARGEIPKICLLDPDGDILVNLLKEGKAKLNDDWACYHTKLYNFVYDGIEFGIVGCAVGSSFAVLVAEELFACGCKLLISMTSAGQVTPLDVPPPYFVLIEKALRDEGTSYHYLPPTQYSHIDRRLLKTVTSNLEKDSLMIPIGASWTTDAPFRETKFSVEYARSRGILTVEMEASALYAFASAKKKPVICFAHVTNQMGNVCGDFEKGHNNGSADALKIICSTAGAWLNRRKRDKRAK